MFLFSFLRDKLSVTMEVTDSQGTTTEFSGRLPGPDTQMALTERLIYVGKIMRE